MKKVLAVLSVLTLIMSMSACTGSPGTPATQSSGTSQGAAPSDSAATANAASANTTVAQSAAPAARSVSLDVLLTGYGRYKPAVDDLITKFTAMELQKNNVTVTFNVEYPEDKAVLQSRLSSGDAPDVFNLHVTLDAPLYDKGGYLPDLSGEPFVSKLYDGVKKIDTTNGKIIAVPLESFVWSCLYNQSLFDDNGLTFPTTITELKNVINVFNSKGIKTFCTPFNDPTTFASWAAQVPLCAVAAQLAPDFYSQMEAGTGSFQTLVDNGWLDVVDLIFANGTDKALDTTNDDGLANFAKGDGAIFVTGPWYSAQIMGVTPDFKLGLAALPIDDNPKDSVVMLAVSTGVTCSPTSKNYDIAKDFAEYFLDDSVTNDFFSACQFNPLATNQNIQTFPWTQEGMKYIQDNQVYAEHAMPSAVYTALGRGAQMYFDKQTDRAGYVSMLNDAYASGLQAVN
jgi:raffinose/stachyose/melibiose transport system substrate-binding protein